jgi:hypothetical protein
MNILERIPGYTNEDMLRRAETLRDVIFKKKKVNVGTKAKPVMEEVNKYKTDEKIAEMIKNSIEHYSNQAVEFRDYQLDIIDRGADIVRNHGFVYLAMEVRTGKTLTSLGIANKLKAKAVLFVTKKKAIGSIESDYAMLNPDFSITVINYESLHLVKDDMFWDLVILDEAHSMGAFPKPSQRAALVADVLRKYKPMVILLSGTPTPESYSQMYHQVYGIKNNPFRQFANFYRFCDVYVKVRDKKVNGITLRDYTNGSQKIIDEMRPYTINYTQQQAGFNAETTEHILEVEMMESTYKLIDRLRKDLVVEGKNEVILGDSSVKLMTKVHQLYSGTIKFESGNSMIVDKSKAEFIKQHFDGCKVGIFYKFKEELAALEQVFGDSLTTDLSVFEYTDKSIALQILSGREGISLKKAEYLVYYNIDFSATSYWQSKDRMTTKDRLANDVYWVFAKGGIEYDIYKAVTKKKDYTINHFKNFNNEK